MADKFETEVCGRCGGCGRYSFNQMHGSVCYGCGGSGKRYTKRGAAAVAYMNAKLATDALSVKVGDRVVYEDALTNKKHTFTIAEIVERDPIRGRSLRDGVMVDYVQRSVDLVSEGGKVFGFGGAIPLRFVRTQAAIDDGLAYQATLTKAGTVRKGPAKPEPEEQLDVIE